MSVFPDLEVPLTRNSMSVGNELRIQDSIASGSARRRKSSNAHPGNWSKNIHRIDRLDFENPRVGSSTEPHGGDSRTSNTRRVEPTDVKPAFLCVDARHPVLLG
jgi:hypothetical protein